MERKGAKTQGRTEVQLIEDYARSAYSRATEFFRKNSVSAPP
jgi:hypothetical protein